MFGLNGEFKIVGKHQTEGTNWELFFPQPAETEPEQVR